MSAARRKGTTKMRIETTKHAGDKRINIPTEELRDFMSDEAQAVQKLLYPRDPSLDPQLVWRGKDDQDQSDLIVDAPPIYIQEKIHPQAIIEDVRAQARSEGEEQFELFSDFNGIGFEDLIDFYKHEQNWANRMILGDSLQVMGSLAEKEGLRGKVQMIYIDPPYGIKFGSNWQVSTRKREVTDGRVADASREPEVVKAFRDTWELGIHSYLTYLRDRLTVARDLLSDSGSVFVQIGDENVHRVRALMDEVFGDENLVIQIVVKKKGNQKSSMLDPVNDFILWYSKSPRSTGITKFRKLFEERPLDADTVDEFSRAELPSGETVNLKKYRTADGESLDFRAYPRRVFQEFPGARLFRPWPITNGGERANQMAPVQFEGESIPPPKGNCWRHTSRPPEAGLSGMQRIQAASRLVRSKSALDFKRYLEDFPYKSVSNWWDGFGGASEQIYVVQTNERIVERCMLMSTDPGDLVLDPTCGSGTTAYVAEQWGRRWITIDTSRVALALARARLMGARYPYYVLSDSREGQLKEMELSGVEPSEAQAHGDIKQGFVYRRSAYVTSGSIANNAEIDTIYDRYQETLESLRQQLNAALGESLGEWQVPREPEDSWPYKAVIFLHDWWNLRQERQKEIDDSIARNSEQEILYDQPYEDNKRLRVAGPFTVESLSPHRVLSTDEAANSVTQNSTSDVVPTKQDFVTTILDNLRKAGVQNTVKSERLTFDRLEPYAGTYIQAEGEYTDGAGVVQRIAVCIGPEHGTVGPQLIKEAAKEAVKGTGFDLLVVCGFAFDPHVSEEAKQYGKLSVLVTKMNPDLAMGDELLKKTGSGNLFMVFGEPDIGIERQDDGKLVIEIRGVDVYDPTTGQIRSNTTDDIVCWFIDTNYNDESFFVRHAYFTGADNPYDKLKRALKAEIDEDTWASLYSTRSRPFDRPKAGKLAVKVINHYGDEVVKICTA